MYETGDSKGKNEMFYNGWQIGLQGTEVSSQNYPKIEGREEDNKGRAEQRNRDNRR